MSADRTVRRTIAKARPVRLCTHCEDSPLFLWSLPPSLGRELRRLRSELADREDEPVLAPVDGCGECQGFTLGQQPRRLSEH